MHKGGCLCGAVKYEVRGEFSQAVYCHCGRCRKASGSAFATNAVASDKDFVVTSGEESLKCFTAGGGVKRYFCGLCGSPIASRRDTQPDIVRVRMGTLDTPVTAGPGAHIFVGSKVSWDVIRDDLPQHQERPPA